LKEIGQADLPSTANALGIFPGVFLLGIRNRTFLIFKYFGAALKHLGLSPKAGASCSTALWRCVLMLRHECNRYRNGSAKAESFWHFSKVPKEKCIIVFHSGTVSKRRPVRLALPSRMPWK
jgi:hypothetical protein